MLKSPPPRDHRILALASLPSLYAEVSTTKRQSGEHNDEHGGVAMRHSSKNQVSAEWSRRPQHGSIDKCMSAAILCRETIADDPIAAVMKAIPCNSPRAMDHVEAAERTGLPLP